MKKKNLKKFLLRKYQVTKDAERNVIISYLEPQEDKAIIWPAGGKLQAELYGLRLPYIFSMNYYGKLDISENDAICLNGTEAEYKVISIKKYSKFKFIEIEKIR